MWFISSMDKSHLSITMYTVMISKPDFWLMENLETKEGNDCMISSCIFFNRLSYAILFF